MMFIRIRHRFGDLSNLSYYIISVLAWFCLCLTSCDATEDPAVLHPNSSIISTEDSNSSENVEASEKVEWPRIVALGDSLTAGLGVSLEGSYPSELQRQLDQAGHHYRVINAGVSGDTTAGALRRLDWVLKSHPNIVILELGANDGLRGHPLKETYSNLKQIIQRLQARGVTILLTGMKIPPNYGEDYAGEFSAIYDRLAQEFDVTFMPFFLEGVAARKELNQADGIHPTEEGYQIIVNNLIPFLIPLLNPQA